MRSFWVLVCALLGVFRVQGFMTPWTLIESNSQTERTNTDLLKRFSSQTYNEDEEYIQSASMSIKTRLDDWMAFLNRTPSTQCALAFTHLMAIIPHPRRTFFEFATEFEEHDKLLTQISHQSESYEKLKSAGLNQYQTQYNLKRNITILEPAYLSNMRNITADLLAMDSTIKNAFLKHCTNITAAARVDKLSPAQTLKALAPLKSRLRTTIPKIIHLTSDLKKTVVATHSDYNEFIDYRVGLTAIRSAHLSSSEASKTSPQCISALKNTTSPWSFRQEASTCLNKFSNGYINWANRLIQIETNPMDLIHGMSFPMKPSDWGEYPQAVEQIVICDFRKEFNQIEKKYMDCIGKVVDSLSEISDGIEQSIIQHCEHTEIEVQQETPHLYNFAYATDPSGHSNSSLPQL